MNAAVVRLPTARQTKVRQPRGPAAEGARLELVHEQRRIFNQTAGAPRSFDELYFVALEFRARLETMKLEYCERSELSFADEHSSLRLRMSGAVACYRIRIQNLAHHTTKNAEQAVLKRELIGDKWLSEPDSFYDQFRESVANDAKRFGIAP